MSFLKFQSTRPHGARQSWRDLKLRKKLSFNPRARMGRDAFRYFARKSLIDVSIHAPAWGATSKWGNPFVIGKVSIHAPAWGATIVNF